MMRMASRGIRLLADDGERVVVEAQAVNLVQVFRETLAVSSDKRQWLPLISAFAAFGFCGLKIFDFNAKGRLRNS